MTEYAFDVKLNAVIRVEANSEEDARDALEGLTLDADGSFFSWSPAGEHTTTARLTEATVEGEAVIFEVDGKPTQDERWP